MIRSAQSAFSQIAITVLAVICIILGAITLPLPLPTGLIFFTIGFSLLLLVSRRARAWFRGFRRRTPWVDNQLGRVEHRLPNPLRRALSGRRPQLSPITRPLESQE